MFNTRKELGYEAVKGNNLAVLLNNLNILLYKCFHFLYLVFPPHRNNYANYSSDMEVTKHPVASLDLSDILPLHHKTYDKNRAPKLLGQPTVVYFHVTVLSIDSINEESMVSSVIATWFESLQY